MKGQVIMHDTAGEQEDHRHKEAAQQEGTEPQKSRDLPLERQRNQKQPGGTGYAKE